MANIASFATQVDGFQTRPSAGRSLSLGRWVVTLGVGMLVWFILGAGIAAAQQLQISHEAVQQIQALLDEKASRTPAQQKLDSHLLIAAKMERDQALRSALPALRTNVTQEADGRVLVDINAEVTTSVLDRITALGGDVVNSHPHFQAIRALMPLQSLEDLAELAEVKSIRPADQFITNKNNTSQGDVAHRANVARTTFGITGAGTMICVLSDGVNSLAARQATGDLPPGIVVLPGQAGSGDEGTAMLEIVYDLAPGATLGFATANPSQAQFAQNILALNAAGCKVIVDDVFYFAEPVFQDGIIAQAVNTVTANNPSAGGSLYFSSAGNSGNLSDGTAGVWQGDFVPTAFPTSCYARHRSAQLR